MASVQESQRSEVILCLGKPDTEAQTTLSRPCSSKSWVRMPMCWIVFFIFEHGPSLECKGVVEGNMLHGSFKKFTEWTPPDQQVPLGSHKITHRDVWKAFRRIPRTSPYHADKNNSLTWASLLLKFFYIDIPEEVYEFASGDRPGLSLMCFGAKSEAAYKNKSRDCEVKLGFSRIRRIWFSSLTSSTPVRCLMHWSVDLKISGGASYRCEACPDEDGVLIGKQIVGQDTPPDDEVGYMLRALVRGCLTMKKRPKQMFCLSVRLLHSGYTELPENIFLGFLHVYLHKVFVGTFKLSENQISQAMKEMKVSGKYHKIRNNCQVWVVKFLRKLEIPVPDEVQTIAERIGRSRRKDKETAFTDMVKIVKSFM